MNVLISLCVVLLTSMLQPSTHKVRQADLIPPGLPPEQQEVCYPVAVRMNDERFLMAFQGGPGGSRIICSTSSDLQHWSVGEVAMRPRGVKYSGISATQRFTYPDLLVLKSGEVLLCASVRAGTQSQGNPYYGIQVRRSSDNGKTWKETVMAVKGERAYCPRLKELPDGSIHLYYTDVDPEEGKGVEKLLTSKDHGYTWESQGVVAAEYQPESREIKVTETAGAVSIHGSLKSGEAINPVLQPVYSSLVQLPHAWLTALDHNTKEELHLANYPRIKCLQDGTYIMFYHGSSVGARIYYTLSNDLINWTEPQFLFKPYKVHFEDYDDMRLFVNMDAVVLESGDLLGVCSFRAMKHYKYGIGSGLMTIRSRDNGKTWEEPRIVYEGPNWEPYIIQIPDGRVQIYFTDCDPVIRNSGTSVIESTNFGYTFGPKKRVSRQYKYPYDGDNAVERRGESIYTDQMPSFRVLSDNKTMIGYLEARLEMPESDKGKTYYKMSVVYNDGLDWTDIGESSEGPVRRHTNVVHASGGYVSVFPTGEVVLSCKYDGYFSVRVLDNSGELPLHQNWSEGWTKALPAERGFWGSTEVIDSDYLISAMHDKEGGMQVMKMYLNRGLHAGTEYGTDRLYLSLESGSEIWFSAKADKKNLYLRPVARLLGTSDVNLDIMLSTGGKIYSTNVEFTGEEIVIPLSKLGAGENGIIYFNAIAEENGKSVSFSNADEKVPHTWQYIRLEI